MKPFNARQGAFPMRALALRLIAFYKRVISPRKGFSCAYRVHTGGASCSTFAHHAIARHGVAVGWLLLRRRFRKCGAVHAAARASEGREGFARRAHPQAGYCDIPCDCDVGHCHWPDFGDALNCGCCDSCDWPGNEERRQRRKERKRLRAEEKARAAKAGR
jgi:uncharacterized protein